MYTELEKIVEWLNLNKLSLNPDETNYIFFRSTNKQITDKMLYVNNIPLTQSETTKFLGVIIHQLNGIYLKETIYM